MISVGSLIQRGILLPWTDRMSRIIADQYWSDNNMLKEFMVTTTDGIFFIQEEDEHAACYVALLNFDYPEYVRVISVQLLSYSIFR